MKIKKKDNQKKIIVYTVLLCLSLFATNMNSISYFNGEKKDGFYLNEYLIASISWNLYFFSLE